MFNHAVVPPCMYHGSAYNKYPRDDPARLYRSLLACMVLSFVSIHTHSIIPHFHPHPPPPPPPQLPLPIPPNTHTHTHTHTHSYVPSLCLAVLLTSSCYQLDVPTIATRMPVTLLLLWVLLDFYCAWCF